MFANVLKSIRTGNILIEHIVEEDLLKSVISVLFCYHLAHVEVLNPSFILSVAEAF